VRKDRGREHQKREEGEIKKGKGKKKEEQEANEKGNST